MKNLNLISDSIKSKKAITTKDFTAWKKEIKKSLTPLDISKLGSEQRRNAIQDRINLAKSFVEELQEARAVLESESGKELLKIQQKDLEKSGEEAIQLFSNEMIELAKEEARSLNWNKATKTLNEAIDFTEVNNGLLKFKPDVKLFLYRAKSQYYQNGIKPALKKGLYEALKIHPKHEALTHTVSHYEILDGKYDAALKAMQLIPRNTSSRTDTIIRYMLQPHTDHGGLEAFTKEGLIGNPGEPDFGRGGFPGGIDPGGIFPDRPFDEDPFADFDNRPDLGGYFGDLPLSHITNGKPLGFPCNFYTYHYSLLENIVLSEVKDAAKPTGLGDNEATLKFFNSLGSWNKALQYLHEKKYDSAIRFLSTAQNSFIEIAQKLSGIFNHSVTTDNLHRETKYLLNNHMNNHIQLLINSEPVELKGLVKQFRDQRNTLTNIDELYVFDWKRPLQKNEFADSNYRIVTGTAYSNNYADSYKFLFFTLFLEDIAAGIGGMSIESARASVLQNPNFLVNLISRRKTLEYPLIMLSCVYIPFAKIEAYRFSKQYEKALEEIRDLLRMNDGYYVFDKKTKKNKYVQGFNLLNPTIEYPFLKILHAQILMEQADKQFKARELKNSFVRADNPKGLVAKRTYDKAIKAFDDWSSYRSNVVNSLHNSSNTGYLDLRNKYLKRNGRYKNSHPIFIREMERLGNPVANILTPDDQLKAQAVNKNIHIANINAITSNRAALLPTRNYPWQRAIQWIEDNQNALSNPVIYAIILEATSKLQQIAADLNYLGYRDDYVPPWKFFYLLDRARYYTDQAKNLQRDYLNFLSNAEREQFQEMGAGQSVSLERMNVNVENARVDQANAELEVVNQNNELAQLQVTNAQQRKDNFDEYDKTADTADLVSMISIGAGPLVIVGAGALAGAIIGIPTGPGAVATGAAGAGLGAIAALGSGLGAASSGIAGISNLVKEGAQREMEQKNLELAISEASQAANVAVAQVGVAEAALTVSNLQAQAALMRLDFAMDNYEFLRNRLTSAEMWFRLAHAIREVANTYLRRAIEMSFLTEQVYEFMIDKRINVIRFDYDNDELGAMLGADYLKADLDYLESHLISTQREKQQKLKCVISMARDFPQALQELSENESAIIPITLEYLERRFPGVYNMKMSAVDMQPLAIMDPTRFSVEMTFMGSGTIRTKTYPVNTDGSGETTTNDFGPYGTAANPWIPNADIAFPVKTLLCPVETCVFTGLTLGEDANFHSFSTQQKKAFEDCPASAGWLVDMSMAENKVVPGSLSDMVITFYITGFYDSDLKSHVEQATANETRVVNKIMSARNQFSDQYFSFERTGKIAFNITPNLLTINDRIGELKNIGIYFLPTSNDIIFNRFRILYSSEFTLDNTGTIKEKNACPKFSFKKKPVNSKEIEITIARVKGKHLFVFIDGEEANPIFDIQNASESETKVHLFKNQGRNILIARISDNNIRNEYRSELFISETGDPIYPDTVYPTFRYDKTSNALSFELKNNINAKDVKRNCIITVMDKKGNIVKIVTDNSGEADFYKAENISKGIINFNTNLLTAITDLPSLENLIILASFSKPLNVLFSSRQLVNKKEFKCKFNKLSTERNKKDKSPFTKHIFPVRHFVSPLDQWIFELDPNKDKFLLVYDCSGKPVASLDFFQDVILFLEYELKRR